MIPAVALGLVKILSKKTFRYFGVAIFLVLFSILVISLPNRGIRDRLFSDKEWLWPETEDLNPVVDYWLKNKEKADVTYVY